MNEFFQEGPELQNQFESDAVLKNYLKRALPPQAYKDIEPELKNLGQRVIEDIYRLGIQAEDNPPKHVPYDPWGRRIDKIAVCPAWEALDRVSAEEGFVATAYERKHGEYSRLHQFAKLYLFGPSSAIYTCPLAMSDGAARAIEIYGDEALKSGAYRRLISRDPKTFWTSGQWMTERAGGSDVSGGTSTVARLEGGEYRLYGTKWFTSATTSQMAMTLARIEKANSETGGGGSDLSLFYLELRDGQGRLKNIKVNRLKDKLGTKGLPTAELTLEGTPARLVGDEGHGVRKIASLFNITRVYNAVSSVSYMRRGLALARDYARKRKAFGKPLIDHPLHAETLANLEVEFLGAFHLAFHTVGLLGKDETGRATKAETAVLRLLTPLAKLYTAKQSIEVISEVLESFGGAGYIEDTGLPKLLRDCQVLSIWEGTTNVLSLDVLRAVEKDQALEPFFEDLAKKLALVNDAGLSASALRVTESLKAVREVVGRISKFSSAEVQASARNFSFSLARIATAVLLLEAAQKAVGAPDGDYYRNAASRWASKDLVLPFPFEASRIQESLKLI